MLRQILRDMYVDPEILAELPEEQREMLFFKIRQEQVRRYNDWESRNSSPAVKRRIGRKVRILEDAHGEPWTWVFGERPGEVTVEEKWKSLSEKRMEEAIRAAILEEQSSKSRKISTGKRATYGVDQEELQVRKDTRKTVMQGEHNKKLQKYASASRFVVSTKQEKVSRKVSVPAKFDNAVDERSKQNFLHVKQTKTVRFSPNSSPTASPEVSPINPRRTVNYRTKSPTVSPAQSPRMGNGRGEVSRSSPRSTRRIELRDENTAKRSPNGDIGAGKENNRRRDPLSNYENITLKDGQDDVISNEEWQSQLRRFKEADERRSAAARRASLEFQRQIQLSKNPTKFSSKIRSKLSKLGGGVEKRETDSRPFLPPRPEGLIGRQTVRNGKSSRPLSTQDVKEWFEDTQLCVLTDEEFIGIPGWFHGMISRPEAEDLLKSKPRGSFLIRVSDKIWGYTLSYKDDERIKHFLVDASVERCYFLFGDDSIRHDTLKELLEYYKVENISLHGEKLRNWVGQSNSKRPDFADLLPKSRNKIDDITKEFRNKLK